MYRATFAMVDLDAFAHNLRVLKRHLQPRTKLMIAVKADAYGHGIEPMMSRIRQIAVDEVAVASIEEAIEIRRIDVNTPILALGAIGSRDLPIAAEHEIQVLYTDSWGPIEDIPPLPCPLQVHIPLDTGMNRLGFKTVSHIKPILDAIHRRSDMVWAGIGTHLACADSTSADHASEQISRLQSAIEQMRPWGYPIPTVHAANSGGLLRDPNWHFDMVRVGIAAYGYSPDEAVLSVPELRPVMHVYSSVTRVATVQAGETIGYGATFEAERKMRVATVAIGYADGFSRILSNCGVMRVRRHDAPVVGRVCMDQVMIDVSGIDGVQVGDFVTFFGDDPPEQWTGDAWNGMSPDERAAWLKDTFAARSSGKPGLPLAGVAKLAQTIPYEMLCQINHRVPRLYVGDPT